MTDDRWWMMECGRWMIKMDDGWWMERDSDRPGPRAMNALEGEFGLVIFW